MKHYGDITKIHGAAVEPVNVIIGGSPCQDLSVAGKQKGIKHTDNGDDETTRSGLFMEQLRIIKEMRRNDIEHGRTGIYTRPRFMVWENVPGAFSSNKGADFGAVLEETIKVVCEKAPSVPIPKRGWPNAGCLTDVAGKWGVAWRVFDAQFWGVPQRRKRIALVADFGGLAAPEILFERESVCGDIEPCRSAGKDTAAETAGGVGAAIRAFCFQGNGIDRAETAGCNGKGSTEPKPQAVTERDGQRESATHSTPLTAPQSQSYPSTCETPPATQQAVTPAGGIGEIGDPAFTITADYSHAVALENHPQDSRIKISENGVVQTLASNMGMGGNNVPLVMEAQNSLIHTPPTDPPPVITATCGSFIQTALGISSTLCARDYKDPQIVCCPINKEAQYGI